MLAKRIRIQTVLVELPVLIAVAPEPASRIVAPFVGEANRDAIFS